MVRSARRDGLLLVCLMVAGWGRAAVAGTTWHFTDVTAEAGVAYAHGWSTGEFDPASVVAGGVAAGDYDRDGWVDLYAVRGDIGPNLLFHNRGDGTFEEVGAAAGVAITYRGASGTFADVDGDGWLDLLVVGVGLAFGAPTQPVLFHNNGDGTFTDVSAAAGIVIHRDCISAAFGDPDLDGDLDLFISQWGENTPARSSEHYWRNQGDGTFVDASIESGIDPTYRVVGTGEVGSLAFTPNFVDVNNDGWPDLLVSGDFHTSQVFLNDGDGTFTNVTDATISDENGMGAAIADIDGDGNLDWFVSSIWDPNGIIEGNWYGSGNRFYRGLGDGHFEDRTSAAGVREGYWGWGSTFSDLDNDGDADLFHVNGWHRLRSCSDDSECGGAPGSCVSFLCPDPDAYEFESDPARAFINDGTGVFTERAAELGLAHTGQGRGVVAFDYDRDGDLDLFITNNQQAEGGVLLRNDGGNANRWLRVRLEGPPPNTEGSGARVWVTAAGAVQMQEVRIGSNYVSQNPAALHFGVGQATTASVRVRWLGGAETQMDDVATDQELVVAEPEILPPTCAAPGDGWVCVPGGGKPANDCWLEWLARGDAAAVREGRKTVITCMDGDDACDAGDVSGTCTFQLALCLANDDPRLPACTAADVAAVAVRKPKAKGKDEDRTLNATLVAALGETFGLDAGEGALFTGRDACSAPLDVAVAVKEKRGKLRAGKRALRTTTASSGKGRDADTLQLVCEPAS